MMDHEALHSICLRNSDVKLNRVLARVISPLMASMRVGGALKVDVTDMMDRESQSLAAVLTVKAASETLVRFFLAMLDAWRRSDVNVLLRSDQDVTLTLILREVQARRQQRTLVERSPVES